MVCTECQRQCRGEHESSESPPRAQGSSRRVDRAIHSAARLVVRHPTDLGLFWVRHGAGTQGRYTRVAGVARDMAGCSADDHGLLRGPAVELKIAFASRTGQPEWMEQLAKLIEIDQSQSLCQLTDFWEIYPVSHTTATQPVQSMYSHCLLGSKMKHFKRIAEQTGH